MKNFYRFFALFVLGFSLFLTSCKEKIMGYSVVLWNIDISEHQIPSGEVVPVYVKSNISHVYIIGTDDGLKIEVPLWQLTEPVKKAQIDVLKAKYSDMADTYASVKLDGLPSRAEPVNTAKQVYRLRKGEIIKILYKGKGAAPMAGKNALEGDWYKILMSDGTQGWCFSYNLAMFQMDKSGNVIGGESLVEEDTTDSRFEGILNKNWYPEYYKTLVSSDNIDLSRLFVNTKFVIDSENEKSSLNYQTIHENWKYEGYTKTNDNEFTLKNIPVVITYKKSDFIVLRYTGENGKPQDINLVTIDVDLQEVIAAEKERRNETYKKICDYGPLFSSQSYGKLTLSEDGTFKWTNFKLLVPSIIPAGTKNAGTATIKYNVAKSLQSNYDGVITFKFDGSNEEINFLYKIDSKGLRLEDTSGAAFNGNQIASRGSSPVIIYFTK